MSEEADTESTTPAVVAPAEPTAEVTFSQEQVNALLAKERATATRKAKQTPKAPTKEQPQNVPNDAIAMLTEQVSALTGLVQASTDKQIAQEASNAFIADTASLNISDTDKAVLKTLKEHSPETYQAKLKEYRSVDNPPDPKGPGHITPGAPSAKPAEADMTQPTSWSRDDIDAMHAAGTFKANLKKARAALPGGRGNLFPAKR